MWEVLELVLLAIIFVMGVTQVVIPAFSKLPFFWLFRQNGFKRLIKAETDLTEAEVESEARQVEREAWDKKLDGLGIDHDEKQDSDSNFGIPETKRRQQQKEREKGK
ncbi:MAG: hypothetical protein NTZ49_00295 [Candidatus Parcubacteria bacterium]|nr:hypothetical protein [Candidatus Parcubacteria bacterium]